MSKVTDMETIALWLAEIGYLFFLAGLAITAPAPRPLFWLVFVAVWFSTVVPWVKERFYQNASPLLVLACAVLASEVRIHVTSSLEDCWPLLPAVVLLLAGLVGVNNDKQGGVWGSGIRRELTVTCFSVVVLGALAVITTAVLTKFYSEKKIPLGDPGFLYTGIVLACLWFGLDAGLRRGPSFKQSGIRGWLWNQRQSVLLAITALVIVVRSGTR